MGRFQIVVRGTGIGLLLSLACAAVHAQTVLAPSSPRRARVDFERILMSGDQAPGFPAGELFLAGGIPGGVSVDAPRIDAAGTVGFGGLIQSATFPLQQGVWWSSAGTHALVARTGAPAPGTTATFFSFPSIYFVDSPAPAHGRLTFHASLSEPFAEAVGGTWLHADGVTSLIVRGGDPVPGAPAGSLFRHAAAIQSESGAFVVVGEYTQPGVSSGAEKEGFWRDDGAGLELVVRDTQQAPGLPGGVVFGEGTSLAYWATFDEWSHDAAGRVAFNAYLSGPGVTVTNDEGVWAEGESGLRLVVREGDAAPGGGPGATFGLHSGFRAFGTVHHVGPRINDRGHVLFSSALSGGGFDHGEAVWTDRSGALELVVRSFPLSEGTGDAAPGLPGHVFVDVYDAVLDDRDQVAVSGYASDGSTTVQGLWWDVGGALALVVRQGAAVSDVPGATITGFLKISQLDRGALLFTGGLSTGGTALFLAHADGSLHTLLRRGMAVDVRGDGSDVRVLDAWVAGAANADLRIPLRLAFTDGTEGLFVAAVRRPALVLGR
jgi:hypothetical protein